MQLLKRRVKKDNDPTLHLKSTAFENPDPNYNSEVIRGGPASYASWIRNKQQY